MYLGASVRFATIQFFIDFIPFLVCSAHIGQVRKVTNKMSIQDEDMYQSKCMLILSSSIPDTIRSRYFG